MIVSGRVSLPRTFEPVAPALRRLGPATVANHIRDDNYRRDCRRIWLRLGVRRRS